MHQLALLNVSQMGQADRLAIGLGIAEATLMENAGAAVAREIQRHYAPRNTAVLCGPGNNGGDGFVVARYLARAGWPVRVGLAGRRSDLRGDAAGMARLWSGAVEPLAPDILENAGLVVDAVFGAGLSRAVGGDIAATIEAANRSGVEIVAVDVPTGVDGDTGSVRGLAVHARRTVTFFRKKPGHVLLPGRVLCGEIAVADIGIPGETIGVIDPRQWENGPDLWRFGFPWPRLEAHKYDRGHAVVRSGGMTATGAARLAARGALRAGAGLVTVASPADALAVNAGHLTAIMVAACEGPAAWDALLADERKNAFVLGPGNGVNAATGAVVLATLAGGRPVVLDADALTSFAGNPEPLMKASAGRPCVMTPHEGEFARLFGDTGGPHDGDKLARTRAAAARAGCVVLLKGADTVIADADGRAIVNTNAPPALATAGAGDVLAGIIAGLMAQGMGRFEAAAAAAWLHGEAASVVGPGLIAEDLPDVLPGVLRRLRDGVGRG